MSKIAKLPGITAIWKKTQGHPQVCVAVLDGLVDQSHPCFAGANLSRLATLVRGEVKPEGLMSQHGTAVTSILFGQPHSSVQGIAPLCTGLIVPIFSDDGQKLSQLDLSRAIEQALNAGANIINISGGQLTDFGEAESWLTHAVNLCKEHNVLLVAAAGNDGCDCLHVPAALPTVLAVGAMNAQGEPLISSNWGETYQVQGILAPGENILGAKPGGGTVRLKGTSFATPIVTGIAALLLSLQIEQGEKPNPQAIRTVLLDSALPCNLSPGDDSSRCLVGKLNISGAYQQIVSAGDIEPRPATSIFSTLFTLGGIMSESELSSDLSKVEAAGCGCQEVASLSPSQPTSDLQEQPIVASTQAEVAPATTASPLSPAASSIMTYTANPSVTPSQATASNGLVYVIGTLGYDFGTEARRDSFKQLMPGIAIDNTRVPANPYDARQMVDYLAENLAEAKSLIWTLNLELTPIYAIEPSGPFARDVYAVLQELLAGQVESETDDDYIERVSIPARITGRTVRLFSGQVIPVVEPQNTRGLYGWQINALVQAAIAAARREDPETVDDGRIAASLESFLNRVYYDLRNLGTTSQDRALNFAATNAFQAAQTFIKAVVEGMQLDSINVQKSPFCRMDSDCWDVQLKFFDPENRRRARRVFRFTIDVSDVVPVTLGEVRSWTTPS
jgi:cyanobactin maturation PatA/PatG family protease